MNKGVSIKSGRMGLRSIFGALLLCLFLNLTFFPKTAKALCFDCTTTVAWQRVITEHTNGRNEITKHIADEFDKHRDWLVNTFAKQQVIPALQLFTEQMTVVAMQQTAAIGMFLDAKHQLETQRLFQELQVQAHKDYQPSTTFCAFGTNVRSLAHSESIGRFNAYAQGQRQLARHLGRVNMAGAANAAADKAARWEQFVNIYCDPTDNNWTTTANTGLTSVCNSGTTNPYYNGFSVDRSRVNIDIDYTRLIENRRTLDVSRPYDVGSPDEIDVQALGNNLYGNNILFRDISRSNIIEGDKPKLYLALRSIAAKRNVAENSYNQIVGMRSLGSSWPGGGADTRPFLGAVLTELGIPAADVYEYTGLAGSGVKDFSYYAQLEILAKKIFQNPDFYANLYDKPANVERIGTALKAIDLMLDRAIYESQLRQEMAMSVLLSSRLRMRMSDINKNLK